MKKTVKIFVSSHKPTDYIHDEIFQPVQVGAALTKQRIKGFQPDNAGDNISELNPRFCELTTQYWAWKNAQADYYGFFHYRRYLSFADLQYGVDPWGSVVDDCIDEKTIGKYCLDGEAIRNTVMEYDLILPAQRDILAMPFSGKNIRDQYLASGFLNVKDLDIMLEVLGEKYPDFLPYAQKYLNGHHTYLNNMFIMTKDLFMDYSAWLFDILFECDKRIDYENYSVEALRTPGHLAERLLNIYVAYLKDGHGLKIKELQTVAFQKTAPFPEVAPAFKTKNIAIGLSANNYYTPYVATVLQSIREHASAASNYDILIMHQDISTANQASLQRVVAGSKNFSLRFIDISRFANKFEGAFLRGHFTIETWFRLLLPEILPQYKKILYLDSDLVVMDDVAKLYNTDLGNDLLAACHDADTAGLYCADIDGKQRYMNEVLKLKNVFNYFQAGVILFNLEAFRQTYSTEEMLQLAMSREWELLDQDVLNVLAEGRVKFLDMEWNVMYDWRGIRMSEIISHAPKYLSDAYSQARKDPRIIHYAGPEKPWNYPGVDFGQEFWRYARETSDYEIILQRMLTPLPQNSKTSLKSMAIRPVAGAVKKAFPPHTHRRELLRKLYMKARRLK